jgi:hypothetical protein
LAERFDELFDNTEVLHKGLVGEFEQIYDESVIEAKSLLVPISWRQLCRNNRRVEWNKRWSVRIIDRPYDSERGLIL